MKEPRRAYSICDSYAIRTPLFSYRVLNDIYNSQSLDTSLWELFKSPVVQEAIYIASPSFYEQLKKHKQTNSKNHLKLTISLLKYITRLCTRCTPFGLFSGMAMGNFADETDIVLNSIDQHKRYTSLDFEFLGQLANNLTQQTGLLNMLQFYPNTSLYQSGEQLRYIETVYENNKKHYVLQRLAPDQIIKKVLDFAKKGQDYTSLVNFIVQSDFVKEAAQNYVQQLIDYQILISNLEPYSIGQDFKDYLIETLNDHSDIPEIRFLKQFEKSSQNLDATIGNDISHYKKLLEGAKALNDNLKPSHLLQVDLCQSYKKNTLSRSLKIDLSRALNLLCKLYEPYHIKNISDFKKEFQNRYETQTIPLANVLDLDYGIGYPINTNKSTYPYLDGISFSQKKPEQEPLTFSKTEILLHQQIKNNGVQSIDLATLDLNDFESIEPELMPTSFCFSQLIQENNITKIILNGFGGNSATSILSRFAHNNSQINDFVNAMASYESEYYGDAIVAEIVHLPENRTGNILFRPKIRSHQINFLSGANKDSKRDIDINDLMLSIVRGQLTLTSRKHKKNIIPFLSNAHNFINSHLPIYRFLCDYQYHLNFAKIGFHWGALSKIYSHLPRITYNNIILAREEWTLKTTDLKKRFKKNLDDDSLMPIVQKWVQKESLKQLVQLKQGDNMLLIDLFNPLSFRMLLSSISNQVHFMLLEYIEPLNTIVKNDEGLNFANEIIFSLTKKRNGS